jgi:hypothetical protein
MTYHSEDENDPTRCEYRLRTDCTEIASCGAPAIVADEHRMPADLSAVDVIDAAALATARRWKTHTSLLLENDLGKLRLVHG